MSNWNFADVWETVAEQIGESGALVHGRRRVTWATFDRRSDGLAATLLEIGVPRQGKVAMYLYNCPEYLESTFATFKAGLVPVNTNYRYGENELTYLWDNADAVAVVFHGAFTEKVDAVRKRLSRVRGWVWVDDGSGPCPEWAVPYEEAVEATGHHVRGPWGRSGDDLYLLYTGGTTGYPKGVMWRQDDLFASLNEIAPVRYPEEGGLSDVRATITGPGPILLPACPLMHGTGAFSSLSALSTGGCVVTLEGRSFDPVELLDAIEHERVNAVALVGDAFAKPMLRALDSSPGRWDISSLAMIVSSGVMWSESTKAGLMRHHPEVLLVDAFSSSEALGMGSSVSGGSSKAATGQFSLGGNARVIREDCTDVEAGSGEVGRLAVAGRNPLGYYKDTEKSESTFRVIDGKRYSIPGDFATVEPDGTIHLLGRGSQVVNTGGEKVFPEEVEEALKLHPSVADSAVVGVPDERFGEAVVAVVERAGDGEIDEVELIEFVKGQLAHFKAPRRVVFVDSIGRGANGKVDYARLKQRARETAGT